jgi:hypothetical protein
MKEKYQIQQVEGILDERFKAKIFSILDASKGYY